MKGIVGPSIVHAVKRTRFRAESTRDGPTATKNGITAPQQAVSTGVGLDQVSCRHAVNAAKLLSDVGFAEVDNPISEVVHRKANPVPRGGYLQVAHPITSKVSSKSQSWSNAEEPMNAVTDLVYTPLSEWDTAARPAFAEALSARYQRVRPEPLLEARADGERRFQLRVNTSGAEPFAALIGPDQERSGAYGGMSFVLFPSSEPGVPALIGMVVGTHGLAPDEDILGRPGHGRKMRAIAAWLRKRGAAFAWAKQDPVRIDLKLPKALSQPLAAWKPACDRYGAVLYAVIAPPTERTLGGDALVADALTAYLDVFFDERQIGVMAGARDNAERVKRGWLATALPSTEADSIRELLDRRKYVVPLSPSFLRTQPTSG